MARSRSPYPPTKEPGARRATTHKPKVPSVALPRTRNFRRWMSITVGLVSCTSGTASQVPISTVSTSCHRCERLWTASCTIAAALGLIRATASRASRHVERERFVRLVRLSIGRGSRRRDASLEASRHPGGHALPAPCRRPPLSSACSYLSMSRENYGEWDPHCGKQPALQPRKPFSALTLRRTFRECMHSSCSASG